MGSPHPPIPPPLLILWVSCFNEDSCQIIHVASCCWFGLHPRQATSMTRPTSRRLRSGWPTCASDAAILLPSLLLARPALTVDAMRAEMEKDAVLWPAFQSGCLQGLPRCSNSAWCMLLQSAPSNLILSSCCVAARCVTQLPRIFWQQLGSGS